MSATSPTPSTNQPIKTSTAPPPPPPPLSTNRASTLIIVPHLLTIASHSPPRAFLVELLIYNGHP